MVEESGEEVKMGGSGVLVVFVWLVLDVCGWREEGRRRGKETMIYCRRGNGWRCSLGGE